MQHYFFLFPGEDERFPGESEEEIAKMRRKRMIKKRSKLEESFPSYLQVRQSKFALPEVLIICLWKSVVSTAMNGQNFQHQNLPIAPIFSLL